MNLITSTFRTMVLLGLLIGLGMPHIQAQTALEDSVTAILTRFVQPAGGLTVALINEDSTITANGIGIASLGNPADDSSLFGMSDCAQHLMAALTLKLVENGTLSLSDQLGTGVVNAPPTAIPTTVTIEQLLKHETGIKDFADDAGFMDVNSFMFADLSFDFGGINYAATIGTFIAPQGNADPAGTFDYSLTNYLVLGEKLEAVTGVTIQKLIDSVLFEGGAADVRFWPSANTQNVSSFLYNLSGNGSVVLSSQNAVLTTTGASTGMVASASTLATYLRNLAKGRILNSTNVGLMTNFQNTTGRFSDGYSYGTERFTFDINGNNEQYIGHYGVSNYKTLMLYNTTSNRGVVVMGNVFETNDTTILDLAKALLTAQAQTLTSTEVAVEEKSMSIFPNPGNGWATLAIQADRPGQLEIEIFDMMGHRVFAQSNKLAVAGKQLVDMEATVLPVGTFIIRARLNDQLETLKYVKR